MSVGFRIYQDIQRVSKKTIQQYRDLPVANIADNMGRLYCVDAAIKSQNGVKLLGPAFTVKLPAGDNLMFHKAIELAQEGDILAISAEGCMSRSLCGALMITTAMAKGIRGFLIDGCIRDLEELQAFDFACYARGVQPNGPYKNGPGEIGAPVAIGGQVVMPGDLLVGDMDGVVVVPKADAEAVVAAARAQNETEAKKAAQYRLGNVDRAWLSQALTEKKCEVV